MRTITAETISANAEKLTANLNAGLDKLEASLPTVPARVLHLQRAVANAYYERTNEFWMTVATQSKDVAQAVRAGTNTVTGQAKAAFADFTKTAQVGTNTVIGQARAVATDVAKTARTNVSTVAGQAAAQSRKVAKTAETSTTTVIDTAINAVDEAVTETNDVVEDAVETTPGSGRPYERWTKAELLERARELEIEGRTTMSKRQLITALRG